MEWPVRKESVDRFWEKLEASAEERENFPVLSRPAVHIGLLVVLSFVFCLGGLSSNKVLEGDEALYSLVPKTIVMTGKWVHVTYNGEPYYFKPPLNFWITAAFFHFLPMNAFTASLGSGLFGALTALLIYLMCRIMFPGWVLAFSSTLVYLTTHEVLHWTRGVHLETVLTFWILFGLLMAYLSRKNSAAIVGMGIAAALGWLAKGPQALYPGAVALILWKTEGVFWRRLVSFWSIASGIVLAAILAPWLLTRLQGESGFAQGYFLKELGRTLFGPTQTGNPFYYYFVKLVESYWPWLPAAAVGFYILGRGWKRSPGARLWLVYAVVLGAVVMITAEKRMRYLFQLYPALSVAGGAAVTFAVQRYPRALRIFLVLTVVAAAGLIIFGSKNRPASPPTRDALLVAEKLKPEDRVWLTDRTEHGLGKEPSVSKSLGFYAPPLLNSCEGKCDKEARPGSLVVARADEADEVARLVRGTVDYANKTLALIKIPTNENRTRP
jgi:4-amino-4-deoxy-L-arabinose transferase-like glycosyltransferase